MKIINKHVFNARRMFWWEPCMYLLVPVIWFMVTQKFEPFMVVVPLMGLSLLTRYQKLEIDPHAIRQYVDLWVGKIWLGEMALGGLDKAFIVRKVLLMGEVLYLRSGRDQIMIQKSHWSASEYEHIVALLRQHIEITEISHRELLAQTRTEQQDIGPRPLYLVGSAVLILLLSFVFISKHEALHLQTESWGTLLCFSLPLALVLAYLVLRNSQQTQLWPTVVVCGLLLGGSLNITLLQAIRLANEQLPRVIYHDFEMKGLLRDDFQQWRPVREQEISFPGNKFGINPVWKGYTPARVGDVRSFPVIHGWLGDLAIQPAPSRPVRVQGAE